MYVQAIFGFYLLALVIKTMALVIKTIQNERSVSAYLL